MQEFEYQLDFLADYSAPMLAVEGGTEFIGGIAGATLGGDFGSMYKSTPYDVDLRRRRCGRSTWCCRPVRSAGHQHERLRGG